MGRIDLRRTGCDVITKWNLARKVFGPVSNQSQWSNMKVR